jgi:hypothetical protein
MDKEKSLEQNLLSWLEENGYPLEMKVASLLRISGKRDEGEEENSENFLDTPHIRQGSHYKDIETNTSREIDLIWSHGNYMTGANIDFVIECKNTKKPWILFTSKEAGANYNRIFSFGILSKGARHSIIDGIDKRSSKNGSILHEKIASNMEKNMKKVPWLWKEGKIGYGITQAFEGNHDAPYKAVYSAVKASLWLLNEGINRDPDGLKYLAAFPVVVTSSPLFECYLNENEEIVLEKVDSGFLFFNQHIGKFRATCIRILTEPGLNNFVQEGKLIVKELMATFPKDTESI